MELSELGIQEARHPQAVPVPVGSLVSLYQGQSHSFLAPSDVWIAKCLEWSGQGFFLREKYWLIAGS